MLIQFSSRENACSVEYNWVPKSSVTINQPFQHQELCLLSQLMSRLKNRKSFIFNGEHPTSSQSTLVPGITWDHMGQVTRATSSMALYPSAAFGFRNCASRVPYDFFSGVGFSFGPEQVRPSKKFVH